MVHGFPKSSILNLKPYTVYEFEVGFRLREGHSGALGPMHFLHCYTLPEVVAAFRALDVGGNGVTSNCGLQ